MTDTAFYDDLAALAQELMADFGTPATLRQVTLPKPGADGKATPGTNDEPGLAVRVTDEETLATLNFEGDLTYAVKFPAQPKAEDHLIHAGSTFSVLKVKLVNPEGTRLMLAFVEVKPA